MGFYNTISGKARSGTAARVVKSGVTHNVPVVYIVKNGITRLAFEEDNGTVEQSARTLTLATARSESVAENAGENYLLIAGGRDGSGNLSSVETINSSLTLGTAADTNIPLAASNKQVKNTRTATHALFFGSDSDKNEPLNVYDSSLTKTTPRNLYNTDDAVSGCHLNGNAYILWEYSCTVLDDALTVVTYGGESINVNPYNGEAVSMKDCILIASYDGTDTKIKFLDDALTMSDMAVLPTARYNISGEYNGSHAIFAGGYYIGGNYYADVDAYDNSLTKATADSLSVARGYVDSARLGNYAIFAGGYSESETSWTNHAEVEIYDKSLTKTTSALPQKKHNMASGTVGNHAIFAGGYTTSFTRTNTVTIYDLV